MKLNLTKAEFKMHKKSDDIFKIAFEHAFCNLYGIFIRSRNAFSK